MRKLGVSGKSRLTNSWFDIAPTDAPEVKRGFEWVQELGLRDV